MIKNLEDANREKHQNIAKILQEKLSFLTTIDPNTYTPHSPSPHTHTHTRPVDFPHQSFC